MMIRPLDGATVSPDYLATQWDRLADARADQLESGTDLSMRLVIVPQILALLPRPDGIAVLDAGCGVGYLTRRLASAGYEVEGLDVSGRSIELARRLSGPSIVYYRTSIEQHAATAVTSYHVVIANMSLMTTFDLDAFVAAARSLCHRRGSTLVASVTHPAFWPRYWRYELDPRFRYDSELIVEAPFKTSLAETSIVTAHVHRPIQRYVSAFTDAGFSVRGLHEPFPTPEVMAQYPSRWTYPRFLFILASTD